MHDYPLAWSGLTILLPAQSLSKAQNLQVADDDQKMSGLAWIVALLTIAAIRHQLRCVRSVNLQHHQITILH
jgi:hypothetical protein